MDVVLKDRLDKLMEQFKKDQSKFYRQYFNARIIVDLGVRNEREQEGRRNVRSKCYGQLRGMLIDKYEPPNNGAEVC